MVVTLTTKGNAKLLQQLKPGFEYPIIWNKPLTKITTEAQN